MARKEGKGGTPAIVELQRRGIAHTARPYDHDPAAESYGMEAAEALGVDPTRVFKTLLAEVDGKPSVAIVPVTGSLDLKALAAAAGGKKAKMLEPTVAERLTGYVVGGISPIGQRSALPTFLDASALDCDSVFVSGGKRGLDLELSPHDLVAVTGATVASIGTNGRS